MTTSTASGELVSLAALRVRTRHLAAILLLATCFAAAQTPASHSRWIALGPEGGDVRSLALDPHDPSRVFLGTSAGELYLSTDAGATWSHFAHFGDSNDYVLDHIVVDPTDANTIYVAAWSIENNGGDIFRSRDAGRTWQALPAMHGKSVRSFAVFQRDPRIMVAGTLDGVFRSPNRGDTWERISPANHAEIKNIESIAIDPRSSDVLYAGTWHLPWKTTDGGLNWRSMKQGIVDDSDVFSIIIDQQNPTTVYLSACSGIYKSENSGELFHKIQGIPFSARRTRVLHQDPANPAVVYAGTTEGLWKTLDAGKTWRRTTASNVIVNDVLADPHQSSHILLATDRSGVLASDDGGQSVRASNHGFSHRQVSTVLADRNQSSTLYAGVLNDKEFGGVFVSHDSGSHWQQMNAGLAGHDIFTLAQSANGDLLAGTHRGVYLYENKVARWRPINVVVTERLVTVKTTSKKTKKKVITTRRELVKSELNTRVARIVVSGDRWSAATSDGVYTTLDHGLTWRGGPVAAERSFFSMDAAGEQILAATPNSLVFSRDGGAAWSKIALPPYVGIVRGVAISPASLWIATHAGVFYSQDNGANWVHVLVGTPPQNLMSVRFDADAQRLLGLTPSGEIYSTHDGRVWRRAADAGLHIRSISIAGGRLLGITPFRGIVAQPESEAPSLRATAGGSLQ
ncbi:MAG: transcriptional regulator [Acidobacteriia bacterium]|nr:transcriptional regulator [Terriglobia bacterium]